jgi:hypothetical protein
VSGLSHVRGERISLRLGHPDVPPVRHSRQATSAFLRRMRSTSATIAP